ncbi:MAG: hypothetical protein M0R22_05750 [Dehalococcoidia bacterium]|nr:hypothetical protein [Dehalococcoidia bacterium]
MREAECANCREQVLERIRRRRGQVRLVTFPPEFVTVAGGMHAAALLSQLLYWTDRATSEEGWVYKTRAEWCDELGLSRYELDTARGRLRMRGLIQESCRLVGARRMLHTRLRIEKLLAALDALPAGQEVPPAPASADALPDEPDDMPTAPDVPDPPAPTNALPTEAPSSPEPSAPPVSTAEPKAIPNTPAAGWESELSPEARAFYKRLDGLIGKELESAIRGHVRVFVPYLETEPVPGYPSWTHALAVLPGDLTQRLLMR